MHRLLLLLLSVSSLAGILSCRADFDVTENWKEIDIIYALLDPNDTVHYVKINKAFLNEGTNALEIAKIEDSLYHDQPLSVQLLEISGGAITNTIRLDTVRVENKDPGIFSYPGQYLYSASYIIKQDREYRLEVRNSETGNAATAQTQIVENIKPLFPTANSQITLLNQPNSKFTLDFTSGRGAKFYDAEMRFYYEEYRESDDVKIKDGVIRWIFFHNRETSSVKGGETIRQVINSEDFFKLVASVLAVDNTVYRKLREPYTFEFDYTGGAKEIYTYMQVNRPAQGVTQKRLEYTNIQDGYGIFSSRNRQVLQLRPGTKLIEELRGPTMLKYKFRP